MKSNITILAVIKEGTNDCDHEWTYNPVANACMTMPIKFITTRICNHCGRIEQTESNIIPKLMDNYEEVYNSFYGEG